MSLKNLRSLGRIIDSLESQLGITQSNQFELLKGLLFYDFRELGIGNGNCVTGVEEEDWYVRG